MFTSKTEFMIEAEQCCLDFRVYFDFKCKIVVHFTTCFMLNNLSPNLFAIRILFHFRIAPRFRGVREQIHTNIKPKYHIST